MGINYPPASSDILGRTSMTSNVSHVSLIHSYIVGVWNVVNVFENERSNYIHPTSPAPPFSILHSNPFYSMRMSRPKRWKVSTCPQNDALVLLHFYILYTKDKRNTKGGIYSLFLALLWERNQIFRSHFFNRTLNHLVSQLDGENIKLFPLI